MAKFTFIHAADLHLGAPFRGLDAAASEVFGVAPGGRNLLAEAGFTMLRRLESVCLESGAAFLILAGDIYDDADGVLRARFALRDMFTRLGEAGVRVFIAHGNHDPLPEGPLPVAWPENVTVFGRDVESACVMRGSEILAVVQGVSHASAREKENLAARFRRYAPGGVLDGPLAGLPENVPADVFQIAALHCNVGGAGGGHAPYAPCALSDLTGAGFDYWALGHVHQGGILHEGPHVVYPGSAQGLHINETGAHGCVAVDVDGRDCSVREVPLAPVVWRKVRMDAAAPDGGEESPDAPDSADELAGRVLARLEEEAASRPKGTEALFCRIALTGATDLDATLRKPGNAPAFLERLRAELAAFDAPVAVWIKDMEIATTPVRDFGLLAERNDLVGEVVRLAGAAREDAALAGNLAVSLETLYGHHKVKKALETGSGVTPPGMTDMTGMTGMTDMAELADSAKSLLCSLLEED